MEVVHQAGAEHGGGDGGLCAEAGPCTPYNSQQGRLSGGRTLIILKTAWELCLVELLLDIFSSGGTLYMVLCVCLSVCLFVCLSVTHFCP